MPRLDLRIVGCRGLPDIQTFGTIDPFCTVELENKRFQTRTIDNSCDPQWNEVFKFNVADADSSQLLFSVWNDNPMSDDFLGCYRFSISGLNRGEVEEKTVLLQQCKGNAELTIRVMAVDFGDVEEEPETQYAPPRPKPQGGLPPAMAAEYQQQYQQQVQYYQQAPPQQFQAPPPPPPKPAYQFDPSGAIAPPGFDHEEYLSMFPDLQAAVDQGNRRGWAVQHWVEAGHKEGRGYGRHAPPFDFDHEEYLHKYIDLLRAVEGQWDRRRWAIEHWLHYGQAEGRRYKHWTPEVSACPDNFDHEQYLAKYPDLQEACGGNPDRRTWAANHYRDYGWKEGRSYTNQQLPEGFDPEIYIDGNPDLVAAAPQPGVPGQKSRALWGADHFLEYGYNEGRNWRGTQPVNRLTLVWARYHEMDVLNHVRGLASQFGGRALRMNGFYNGYFGDPAPGIVKTFSFGLSDGQQFQFQENEPCEVNW